MIRIVFAGIVLAVVLYTRRSQPTPARPQPVAFSQAQPARAQTVLLAPWRGQHPTSITHPTSPGSAPDTPAAGVFDLISYPAPGGALPAYRTPDPHDGQRHPAIVWITGGDCNSIGDVWSPQRRDNDQSAAAYRLAGIAMMFPSLRGGNNNPGSEEKFFGEVDDVIAAADSLAKCAWVDPTRIYLGGHSTGGTLTLLVSESTDRFRAVFCFGPVEDIRGYGSGLGPWPFDLNQQMEWMPRSPGYWLASVKSPTFVLEGDGRGNSDSLKRMQGKATGLSALHWAVVPGKTHFTILSPANELLARKILADTGENTNIDMSDVDVDAIAAGK